MKDELLKGKTPAQRKEYPVGTGFLDYFPQATAEVANVSFVGNAQHNGPNTPLKWDRTKSTDESDAMMRHFLQRGAIDTDGVRHSAKLAWRAMAFLEKELETVNESTSADSNQSENREASSPRLRK